MQNCTPTHLKAPNKLAISAAFDEMNSYTSPANPDTPTAAAATFWSKSKDESILSIGDLSPLSILCSVSLFAVEMAFVRSFTGNSSSCRLYLLKKTLDPAPVVGNPCAPSSSSCLRAASILVSLMTLFFNDFDQAIDLEVSTITAEARESAYDAETPVVCVSKDKGFKVDGRAELIDADEPAISSKYDRPEEDDERSGDLVESEEESAALPIDAER
mmetsp:Transcript_11948/g.18718  ORF Transcript_11948/g.18718 Transcript_11948/m.18718 type:complete len:216 (-) Transcript_11948:68-715(-)